jgi:hypothetical protein
MANRAFRPVEAKRHIVDCERRPSIAVHGWKTLSENSPVSTRAALSGGCGPRWIKKRAGKWQYCVG